MSDAHADVEARVRAAFAAELCCQPGLLRPDARLADLPGLDSLKLLRLIGALETEFNIGLDDELLHSLRTLADVTALITEELSAMSALGDPRP
jgi:acyl carrier protein